METDSPISPSKRSASKPRPSNLVDIEPPTALSFSKSSPSAVLKLTNPVSEYVAFKVKTTAHKEFIVKPSYGILGKAESQKVHIRHLKAGKDGPAANPRFLVQAVVVNSMEPISPERWTEFPKESIQEVCLHVQVGAEEIGDVKAKYEELLRYTLMLERENKKLEANLQPGTLHASEISLHRPLQLFGSDASARMLELFRRFDQEGNGLINKTLLYDALLQLCPELDFQIFEKCFGSTDLEKEGGIDYIKFVSWLFMEGAPATMVTIKNA